MKSNKVLLSSAFAVLLSVQAQADDCRGSICVGKFVIDTSNAIGEVTGFPDLNTARYKVGAYPYDAALTKLKVEVGEYNGISPQKKVIDTSNAIGTVLRVFEDGRAQYKVGGYPYVSNRLEPEVDEAGFLRKGTVVIDTSNAIGMVETMFRDQRIQYKIGPYSYVTASKALTDEVPQLGAIKAGTLVIDTSNAIGTTTKTFRDGRIQYQVGPYKYITTKLEPEVASLGSLVKDVVVIDTSDSIGKVISLFADGRIQYQVGPYKYVTKSLKAKVETYDGIQTGDTVIDNSNSMGTALHIFEDGRIQYQVGPYKYISTKLSPKVDEVNGFKAGMIVIDNVDSVGIIQKVFRDGRVNYQVSTFQSVAASGSLSKEVDSHPTYQKGTTYATDSYQVGKPIRFFENKKIQLEMLAGGNAAASTLYLSVESLAGYQAELAVVDAQHRDATVKQVFENGAVVYELKNPENDDGKNKALSGKIHDYFIEANTAKLAELRKEEQRYGIYGTARKFLGQDDPRAWSYRAPYVSVATPEKMPEIKKALSERLFDEPELIDDRQLRRTVRDFLTSE